MKKVYDLGYNDYDGVVYINGRLTRSYSVWCNLLQQHKDLKNESFICNEWLMFSAFKKWFDCNYPMVLAVELDMKFTINKTLFENRNKIFSPDKCIFLPEIINSFLERKYSKKRSGYTGVWYQSTKKSWIVQITDFDTHEQKYVGHFSSKEEADKAYEKARKVEALKARKYMKQLGYADDIISRIN